MLASGAASAEGPTPLHLHCPFTSRLVCRCIYGTRTRLAANFEQASDGTGGAAAANGQRRDVPAAASDVMARARAAWRLLHHADASQDDPVVVMLPKLVRHGPPARVPGTAGAAARLEAAEAAALAAVRMAASMAAAAGLPYRPPDGVALDGLEGIVQADHSELERQVQAVHTAQETRQAAATRAAAAAAAAAGASLPEATPSVMPLSAFMAADAAEGAVSPGVRMRRSRSLEAAPPVEAGQLQHAHSLPSPSSASGASGGALARRRSGGKPPAKLSSGAGRAGPGKGGKGKQGAVAAARRAAADRPGAGAEPAPPPNLAPSGDGYQPHGPSTATPPMAWLLKAQDLSAALQGRLVQVPEGAACSGNGGSRKRGASAGDPPAANPAAAGGGGHAKRQRLDVGLYDGMLDLPSAAAAATEAPLLALPFGGGISDDLLLSPSAGFKEDGEMQEEQALGWRSQSGDELLLPEGPEALLAAHEGMPGGSESDAALLALAPPSSSLGGAFGSGSGSLRFASLHGSGSGSGNLVNTSGVANEQLQPAIHPPEQPVQAVLTAAVAAPPADEPADEPAGKPAAANKPAAAEEPS
ncbi:hypothetical protein C2E20_8855 [Micractinium conductrix]|uniref:Uncharacterized protein n=1 Tax=Micractinium conductrix TaxID=554055 RepID=A0A2P6V065_9CHLO|nr:hypothetical protein C2E20_8855 [Micractinium conductrix]|eukprot:PSC67463.1 hypothetical protein C2E20_8855 [Micractinium conductrix]